MKRSAAVAGQFYHSSPLQLKKQVEQYIVPGAARVSAKGIVSPHAGLIYSGAVAGEVYSRISFPDTFVLVGPNHTGLGCKVALMGSGEWELPSAIFAVDERLSRMVLREVPLAVDDQQAHRFEHSLEVQLPFIAYFSDRVKIVPMTVMMASLEECAAIGTGLAAAIREVGSEVVIVASSDMSHYVSEATARRLDGLAVQQILDLNPEGLYSTVRKEHISMCGVIPATIMLYATKALGATKARLIRYATSAEASGDYDRVVGYAGIIVT